MRSQPSSSGCAATAEPPQALSRFGSSTPVEGLAAAEAARADDLVNGRTDCSGASEARSRALLPLRHHSFDQTSLRSKSRAAAAQSINGVKIGMATELRPGPIDTMEKANITAATLASALDRDHDTFEGVIARRRTVETVDKFITGLGYPAEVRAPLEALVPGYPDRAPQMREAERETAPICQRSTSSWPRRRGTGG